jgi:hypothetical protein
MIPFPISYLLKNLDDFERRFNDDALIAQGMSEAVIILALGVEWFTRHVKPNNNPDPWMLNGSQQWFSSHPVSPPDQRPVIFRMRVTRLGDALFTVIRRVRDSELIKQRFLTRNDTRSSFIEAEVASMLAHNNCAVRIVKESGVRGQDFDLEITLRGLPVNVEVTAIAQRPLNAQTLLNRLRKKCNQVPKDNPAILYIHIPDIWMRNRSLAFLVLDRAIRRFFLKSRRYNMICFIWEEVANEPHGFVPRMSVQPVFNNHARFPMSDYRPFCVQPDKWGTKRMSDSILQAVRTYRMLHQEGPLQT